MEKLKIEEFMNLKILHLNKTSLRALTTYLIILQKHTPTRGIFCINSDHYLLDNIAICFY